MSEEGKQGSESYQTDEKIEKYASDLATIKGLLLQVDEKPFLEYWAFFAWGGFILLGTFLQYVAGRFYQVSIPDILLKIWLPMLLCSAFFEIAAWIRRMSKESLPFFSKSLLKIWVGFLGTFVGSCFLIYMFYQVQGFKDFPIIIQIEFAFVFIFYAQISYSHFYLYSYLLVLSAIILYFLGLSISTQFLIVGLLLGCVSIAGGIYSWRKEKQEKK
ncbi:MAG: hypothetical protein GY754_01750 [bacterium]|nr:hypothetical protein [bacterium]